MGHGELHDPDQRVERGVGGGGGKEEGNAVVTGGEAVGELDGREDVAGAVEGNYDDLAVGHSFLVLGFRVGMWE